jgi:hypothetical protein
MPYFVPKGYEGQPQLTLYWTEELREFIRLQGGRPFVRALIMHEYKKKPWPEKSYHFKDFGGAITYARYNLRMHPAVKEFVLTMGGGPWVRDLVYRYMILLRRKALAAKQE